MGRLLIDDDLWNFVEPLLPRWTPSPKGGRPPVSNRVALTGIVFVLRTGIPWEDFPQEMGCCGMTLWNRLRDWQAAGVWDRIHRVLRERLQHDGKIDWRRASVDTAQVPAKRGARRPARTRPTAANPARSTA